MRYTKGFDTLRAFGTFCVIIGHYGVWFDASRGKGKFIKEVLIPDGGLCVYFFFVLSGFLITSILLNAKHAAGNSGRLYIIKSYFIRRSLKIYPIYYVLLFVLFLLNFPDVRHNIIYFASYTSNLLIYRTATWNAFCVTWTLSIEEQFYLLWPFVVLFIKNKHLKWVFIAAIMIGIISTYITVDVQGHIAPCLVYNCFDAFGIGGLYAWVKVNNYRCKQFEHIIKVAAYFGIAAYFYWKISLFFGQQPLCMFLEKTMFSFIGTWLIILVINNGSVWLKTYLWENRVLNFIGKMSYGIYLYHDVYLNGFLSRVNYLLNVVTANHHRLNAMILDPHYNYWIHIVIIFSISIVSYLLIEQPILSFKKFFSYNKPTDEVVISQVFPITIAAQKQKKSIEV